MSNLEYLKYINVLYLEDDLELAKNIISSLENFFHNVYHSDNLKIAANIYDKHKIDLMIIDIELIDGKGLDFIKAVRKTDVETPIFIASSHSSIDHLLESIPLQLIDFIVKPITFEKLIKALEMLVEHYQKKGLINVVLPNNIIFNPISLTVDGLSSDISITNQELALLNLLLKYKNSNVTYMMIEDELYSDKNISKGTIRNQIQKLRLVFGEDFVSTISGVGYRLKYNNH